MCIGCDLAQTKLGLEGKLQLKCPFCREALPATKEELNGQLMKRAEANDPEAMYRMGMKRYEEGDYKAAFDYLTRAAALGEMKSHFRLSTLYHEGKGVEKDKKNFFIIQNRLRLEGTLLPDKILHFSRKQMAEWIEQ